MDDLPVGALHRFVVWVIGIGLFFDMYEIFLVSTIGAALQNEYGLSRQSTDFKLLLASAFIGMFVGAMCLGSLADRIGRRKAFLLTLTWYSAFSLVGAFSVNADMLVACRFLTGIGVGAIYPVADSFLSEILPKEARAARRVGLYDLLCRGAARRVPRAVAQPVACGRRSRLAHHPRDRQPRRRVRAARPASAAGEPALAARAGRTADAYAAARRFAESTGVRVPEQFAEPVEPQRPLRLGERIALLRREPYGARYVMLAIFHLFGASVITASVRWPARS